MITWMQRHRKYLVITIWISTFAFIGAGFVGWGQYSYGDKAGAVAKVGDISITQRQWQQAYNNLYSQYNQIFQGNFDQEQAKSFGLEDQALKQSIEQALILNLANSYNLMITEKELSDAIIAQNMFFENGHFSKALYTKVLKQNGLNISDYENDMRDSMLIRKVLALFQSAPITLENETFNMASAIADQIEYKLLDANTITLDTSDTALKSYWEMRQQNYMSAPSYDIEVLIQEPISANATEAEIEAFYKENRLDFKDAEGKILEFAQAKDTVIAALDDKATNKQALRGYIAFKKEKLDESTKPQAMRVSLDNNPLDAETLTKITALKATSPFIKPVKINDRYTTVKLITTNPATPKSFEEAKLAVLEDYKRDQQSQQLQKLAQDSVASFKGQVSPYLTAQSKSVTGLNDAEALEFIKQLFAATQKRGYIVLGEEKVVLYNIIDQKIQESDATDSAMQVARLKASLFDKNLIEMLKTKYSIESFVGGN